MREPLRAGEAGSGKEGGRVQGEEAAWSWRKGMDGELSPRGTTVRASFGGVECLAGPFIG